MSKISGMSEQERICAVAALLAQYKAVARLAPEVIDSLDKELAEHVVVSVAELVALLDLPAPVVDAAMKNAEEAGHAAHN